MPIHTSRLPHLILATSLLCGGLLTCVADKSQAQDLSQRGKQQPLFDRINVPEAWKITKGDPTVLIGVIDNGFDFFHPDLKGQLLPGFYFPGGYHGEFYENMAHGTMVASIIAAAERPDGGMVGLSPRCKVVTASQGTIEHAVLKLQRNFFQANPKATLAQWQAEMTHNDAVLKQFGADWVRYQYAGSAEAIRYLVDRGVRVINISGGLWRSACPDDEAWGKLEAAFAYAATKNVVIVLAAGNDALERSDYPGDEKAVLIVGATNLDDTRWEKELDTGNGKLKQASSYGRRLSVMAPAENVVVCQPHEPRFYKCDDGPIGPTRNKSNGLYLTRSHGATSCAAPVVTSLVALVSSVRPDLDAPSVVSIVRQGCDDLQEPGFDPLTGYGRVNFGKTLQIATRRAEGGEEANRPRESPADDDNIEIAGIGVALDVKDGRCLVHTVLPDSPAVKLGAPRVGDQILAVAEVSQEPVSVKGKSLAEVVKLIRGKKETVVRLIIVPNGKTDAEECVVSLTRGSVRILDTMGDGELLKPNTEIPDFEYVHLDKVAKGRIRDHIGKVVVLDFWASWCVPCIQLLDKSQALLEKHPDWQDKVDFIAVSVDEHQGDAVRAFEKRKWGSMTVVWAGPDVMKPYHLNSMPTVYLVDPDGRVISADQRLDLESLMGGSK